MIITIDPVKLNKTEYDILLALFKKDSTTDGWSQKQTYPLDSGAIPKDEKGWLALQYAQENDYSTLFTFPVNAMAELKIEASDIIRDTIKRLNAFNSEQRFKTHQAIINKFFAVRIIQFPPKQMLSEPGKSSKFKIGRLKNSKKKEKEKKKKHTEESSKGFFASNFNLFKKNSAKLPAEQTKHHPHPPLVESEDQTITKS